METGAGIIIGLGALAAAVFLGRQLEAGAATQIAAMKKAADAGAGLGDYLAVGTQAVKAYTSIKK